MNQIVGYPRARTEFEDNTLTPRTNAGANLWKRGRENELAARGIYVVCAIQAKVLVKDVDGVLMMAGVVGGFN